jgi:hypothetical protein
VQNYGELPSLGPTYLNIQGSKLPIQAGFVPVQVCTDFTNSRKCPAVEPGFHHLQLLGKVIPHIAGMQTHHRHTEVTIATFAVKHGVNGMHIHVGHEDLGNPRSTDLLDHLIPVGIKFTRVNMGMGVNQGHGIGRFIGFLPSKIRTIY